MILIFISFVSFRTNFQSFPHRSLTLLALTSHVVCCVVIAAVVAATTSTTTSKIILYSPMVIPMFRVRIIDNWHSVLALDGISNRLVGMGMICQFVVGFGIDRQGVLRCDIGKALDSEKLKEKDGAEPNDGHDLIPTRFIVEYVIPKYVRQRKTQERQNDWLKIVPAYNTGKI